MFQILDQQRKREREREGEKEVREIGTLYYLTIDRVKGCWSFCWVFSLFVWFFSWLVYEYSKNSQQKIGKVSNMKAGDLSLALTYNLFHHKTNIL